jgi:peptidoglycan DL-endopeptidase LytF
MSRRDTIIIAALINASLLALLFMLAVDTDDDKVSDQPEINHALVESAQSLPIQDNPSPVVITHIHPGDEVDNFLKNFSASESSQPILTDDEFLQEPECEIVPTVIAKSNIKEEPNPVNERFVEVIVKRGDALEKIARANGTTVEAIKKANHLSTEKLIIGQVLRVPLLSNKPAANTTKSIGASVVKSQESKNSSSSEPQFYVVKSGDNPWKIAKQFHVKFDELLKLNNLDEEKARNLKIGDKIRVR